MFDVLAFSVIVSAGLSLVLTPVVIKFAFIVGAVDTPDERKIHKRPMPRLGGLAAFVSFVSTLVVVHTLLPQAKLDVLVTQTSWLMVAVSLTAILLLGVCDDMWSLKPGQKFLVQFIAGTLVYLAGFKINSITDPLTGGVIYFGIMAYPLTVLWVVGITNAFNLIDGLDGLAAGIAVIAGLTVSAIALLHNDVTTAVIGIALVGAVLGFLRYNFNPAKIFLGDSGSLFLGFTLAVLSIKSSTKGSTAFSFIVPLLALGVPIIDTSLAMMRRILRSFMPDQQLPQTSLKKLHSMFLPDKRHIHHQLLAYGFSHKEAVLILYLVSSTFGLCAFLVTAGSFNSTLILMCVGVAAVFAVRKLGYREMALLRNGLLLRFYNKTFVKHVLSQVFLDLVSMFGAFYLAYILTSHSTFPVFDWRVWALTITIIGFLQLMVFLIGGLYRRTIALLGLGDLLQIMKATAVAAFGAMLVLIISPIGFSNLSIGLFLLLDFYFLATLVIGARVAFHAMNYIFSREKAGEKALIYGADSAGLITLQALLAGRVSGNKEGYSVTPVGFLDDDPAMEGKYLDGFPVFGGHWKLEGLMNKMKIGEIVIANPNMSEAAFQRVKKIADEHNVPIKIHEMRLESLEGYYRVGVMNQMRRRNGSHRPTNHGLTPKTA